jgi:hypothetical protein
VRKPKRKTPRTQGWTPPRASSTTCAFPETHQSVRAKSPCAFAARKTSACSACDLQQAKAMGLTVQPQSLGRPKKN